MMQQSSQSTRINGENYEDINLDYSADTMKLNKREAIMIEIDNEFRDVSSSVSTSREVLIVFSSCYQLY